MTDNIMIYQQGTTQELKALKASTIKLRSNFHKNWANRINHKNNPNQLIFKLSLNLASNKIDKKV